MRPTKQFISVLAFVLISLTAFSQSLTTFFAADNSFDGNVFDITATITVAPSSIGQYFQVPYAYLLVGEDLLEAPFGIRDIDEIEEVLDHTLYRQSLTPALRKHVFGQHRLPDTHQSFSRHCDVFI